MKAIGAREICSDASRVWSRMRAGLFAVLFLAAQAPTARADDLPLPSPFNGLGNLPAPLNWLLPNYRNLAAPYSWSGFFASPLINYQIAQFSGAGGRSLKDASGVTFGGEAGYNFQINHFVFGPQLIFPIR